MEDPSIDMIIENEDYLVLRELQMRQWKLRHDYRPRLEYKSSSMGSSHDLGGTQSFAYFDNKDSGSENTDDQPIHYQSPLLQKMCNHIEEYFHPPSKEVESMDINICSKVNSNEDRERNVNELIQNKEMMDHCQSQNLYASEQDSLHDLLPEMDKGHILDLKKEDSDLEYVKETDHGKVDSGKVDSDLEYVKDTDHGKVDSGKVDSDPAKEKAYDLKKEDPDPEKEKGSDPERADDFDKDLLKDNILHENDIRINALPYPNLPLSYSFLKDVQLKKYDKPPYCNVNVKTERGNIKPVKSLYSKEQVDLIMDLGNSTPLERFQLGKEIIHNIIPEDHRFLLPKTRSLIIAETGVRSACLYESLSEWLLEEEGHFSIAPLPFYYREWYNIYGYEYRKRKLTHNISKNSTLALQLREAINSEIVDNADALFHTFHRQMLGDDYKNANSLRHAADFKRNQDHMGGLAQIVMFSVMAKTPILVWEHDDESAFWLSSMITGGVTEWNKFSVNHRHVIPNPHNMIIHLLYNRRASEALSHYEVLVVFNHM